MSIITQQKDLEAFSDDMLVKETQAPSGQYPLFLVAAEVQRRNDLRNRFEQQAQMGKAVQPSILEQRTAALMGGGIGGAVPQAQQGQVPPQMGGGIMQQFQTGGLVRQEAPHPRFNMQTFSRDQLVGPGDPRFAPIPVPPDPRFSPPGAQNAPGGIMGRATHGPGTPPFVPETYRPEGPNPFSWFADFGRSGSPPPSETIPPVRPGDLWQRMMHGASRAPGAPDMGPGVPGGPGKRVAPEGMLPAKFPPEQASQAQEAVPSSADSFMAMLMENLSGLPDEVREQLNVLGESEQVIKDMIAGGEASEEKIRAAQDERSDAVMDLAEMLEAESAVERALSQAQRTPDQLAGERKWRAFSQLGGVIGGSSRVGDVAVGMSQINENLYQMREGQEQEQQDIALALATAKDGRELQRRQLLIEQHGQEAAAEIGALERAHKIATTALNARALNGNAAANLLDSLSRATQLQAALGTGSNVDPLDKVEMFNAFRSLYSDLATGDTSMLGNVEESQVKDMMEYLSIQMRLLGNEIMGNNPVMMEDEMRQWLRGQGANLDRARAGGGR